MGSSLDQKKGRVSLPFMREDNTICGNASQGRVGPRAEGEALQEGRIKRRGFL